MQIVTHLSIAIFVFSLIIVGSQSNEIDSQCIDCICKATGRCQYPLGCSNVGSGYYCGPLQISWSYWSDGGKLGDIGNKHDFEDCLTNKECAEQTVRNYMRKYGQDCNGDGLITCADFAILHKTGYRQCKQSSIENTKYWQEFTLTQCYQAPGNTGNLIREQPISHSANRNGNHQPNVVRNVFTSSSSSTIRNIRRTISTGNHHHNTLNERAPDLSGFARSGNTFKELENIENLHNRIPTAFDNFDSLNRNHNHHDFNAHHNLNNNHNFNNHNELTIETSRVARPAVRTNVNRNHFASSNRKPLSSIRPSPPRSNDQPIINFPNANDTPDGPVRVITVNGNVNGNVRQPNSLPSNDHLKLSNATVTIDSKCLDCICYGSTKCNLNMKCSGHFCGPYLISHAYWKEGGQLMENYVSCANDFNCAKQTVANYMARHNRDCDLNQELQCEDFAIIHQLGGYECEKNSKQIKKSHYYMNFAKCYFNDDFHVFTNDDEPVTGYSIIPAKPTANQPANAASNQIDPRINPRSNQPRNPIPPEINLTNDWRPIDPFSRNNDRTVDRPNGRTNENRNENLNNQPLPHNNNNFNSRPINSVRPPLNNNNNNNNFRAPPPSNVKPINQPPVNNQPIIVSNNRPDWVDSNENNNNSENNDERPANEEPPANENQPLSRSTRRPLRPPPRAFESNEEVSEQPNVEAPNNSNESSNNNLNSYSPVNGNTFEQPEVVPIENNHRRTSPRSASFTSNVIPVQPNSPVNSSPNSPSNLTISKSCLDCICEATTSRSTCADRLDCFINNYGELVCGPYHLNRFFWVDSGKTNDNGQADAFEQCASDRICSQQTIAAYMRKHSTDCDNDGQVDCIDFAAMVRVGKACTLQNLIDSNYWNRFQQCYGFGDD